MRQLQQENQQLRNMLEAAMRSCGELEPSRRDLTLGFEAEERRMPGDRAPLLAGGRKDAMPDYQEDLGRVTSQICSNAVSAWPLQYVPHMPPRFAFVAKRAR